MSFISSNTSPKEQSHAPFELLQKAALALLSLYILSTLALAQTTSQATSSPQPRAETKNAESASDAEEVKAAKVGWTDVEAIIPAVGFLISFVGLGLLIWQIRLLGQQIKLLNQGIAGETHSRLYDHYLKVNELLWQKPLLRPYFYDGKGLEQGAAGYDNLRVENRHDV